MALFSRIFQNRRNSRSTTVRGVSTEDRKRCGAPEFEKSQIRLVLFRDHDLKGRSLLLDSAAVQRAESQENVQNSAKTSKFYVPLGKSPRATPEGGGVRERDVHEATGGTTGPNGQSSITVMKPGSDTKMLGEMMFGSVAMSYKGSTFKVHSIRSPPQVMMTKVFRLNTGSKESTLETESLDGCSIQSIPGDIGTPRRMNNPSSPQIAHSVPMDVPSPPKRDFPDMETEDSGFSNSLTSSTSSLCTSLPSPSSSASNSFTSSLNSMHRRLMRSQTTSLEYNLMKRASDESMTAPSPLPASKRPPCIGAGIVFNLPGDEAQSREFQHFLFSHIMLIESHINKLSRSIERAYITKKMFERNVYEAFEVFIASVCDLYLTPRLSQPVWLSMTSGNTMHRIPMCQRFLKELMVCLDKYDTKNTKFFVSTMVTAVLTHHLAWVPTVTPAWATPSRTYTEKHSAKWLDAIAKSHPYNPLWAQLGDLYGAIGFPTRLSRTVVIGRKHDVVSRMLYILSYFIRCSEVLENTDQQPVVMETEYLNENEEEPDEIIEADVLTSGHNLNWKDNGHGYGHISGSQLLTFNQSSLSQHENHVSTSSTLPSSVVDDGLDSSTNQYSSIQSYDLIDPDTVPLNVGANNIHDSVINNDLSAPSSAISNVDHLPCTAKSVCDSSLSLSASDSLNPQVPCNHKLSVIIDSGESYTDECLCPPSDSLNCESNEGARDLDSCIYLEEDFSLLHQDLKRLRLEHGDNCMESSADSTCTLTQSSDDQQLTKSLTENPPHIDIPTKDTDVSCQLSPASPLNDTRREVTRNVGRVNIHQGRRRSETYPTVSPKSKSPSANNENHKHPAILLDGSVLPADTDEIHAHALRTRKGSTQSETSSSKSRDDLDSGIFETGNRFTFDCPMSRDSSADNLFHMGGTGEAGSSSSNSETSMKECNCPKEVQKALSTSTFGQIRVPFERSSSIFDEYFQDDDSEPPAPSEHLPSSNVDCKRMASIEGSSSIFDEYLNEPCPDVSDIPVTISSSIARSDAACADDDAGTVNMFDEYFTSGDGNPVMADGAVRQQVEDTLNLMLNQQREQQKQKDDETVTTPSKAKRPGSLTLDISAARKSSSDISRQSSMMSASSKGFSTPTSGGRRRHQSAVSTTSIETVDFFRHLKEVPLPRSEDASEDGYSIQNFERNFGRSLLAGFSDHYLSDFVLHGTKDVNFQAKLHGDLTMAVQEPVLDEPIAEAACVIADTDKWSIRLQTCQYSSSDRVLSKEMTASRYILDTMESVHDLWKLKMSPEFCLMHLEDKLQEIYFKSEVLAEYIRSHQKVSLKELSNVLDFDASDLPLMLAVAGTHSSLLTLALMN